MWGLVWKVDLDLVDVTPSPALGWIIAFHDRMARLVIVGRGVPMRGLVAAAHMPAGAADSKMNPGAADLEAFLATARSV